MRLCIQLFSGILLCFTVASCKQQLLDDCSRLAPVSISTNSPVPAGDDMQLVLSNVDAAQSFSWKGPDGFTSTDKNPVIKNAQADKAGSYSVTVFLVGDCVAKAVSDSVIVTLAEPPCSPADNTARLDGVADMTFSGWSGEATSSSYLVERSGSDGDIFLEFAGTGKPAPGTYSITPLGGEWMTGFVRLRVVSNLSNWPAAAGKLYVTTSVNNKLIITFCEIPVVSQSSGYNTTLSARMIEQ